jgi:anti-sigma factor (TIGR02949 family)
MTMRCNEVERLVQPYVDGEFEESERGELEEHIASCPTCQAQVSFHVRFKADLKARVRRPALPEGLRERVLGALDRADDAGEGPVPRIWRRALPVAGVLAVAAALVVFFMHVTRPVAASPIVEEAIRSHVKNLPIEITGSDEAVRAWMAGKVPVPVRPPRLGGGGSVVLVGARVGHLHNRDAAQLVYRVAGSQVTVYVFDPAGMAMRAPRKRIVRDRVVYLDGARGYTVVFYRDRGVGYAFASDLDADQMLRLVSASFVD